MSSLQLTYGANMPVGYDGQIASNRLKSVVTKYSEEAMKPGRIVSPGVGVDGVVLGGDGTGIGVTVRKADVIGAATGEMEYADNKPVPVLKQGEVYIYIATATTAGQSLKYTDATGVIAVGVAAAGETDLPAVCKCLDTQAAAGIVRCYFGGFEG